MPGKAMKAHSQNLFQPCQKGQKNSYFSNAPLQHRCVSSNMVNFGPLRFPHVKVGEFIGGTLGVRDTIDQDLVGLR